jgi:hypothetical protein
MKLIFSCTHLSTIISHEGYTLQHKGPYNNGKNLGKVFKIEPMDSYIKKLVGPMVTIEILDISKLLKCIKIPLVDSHNLIKTFVLHKITYLGLSNQCDTCQQIRHIVCTCPNNKTLGDHEYTKPTRP